MKNLEIRKIAKEHKVNLWEIAEKLNLMDCNFSRKLRKELSDNEKNKILKIINAIKVEKAE